MHPARTQNNQKTIKKQSKSTQNNQKTIKTPLPGRGHPPPHPPRAGRGTRERGVLIYFWFFLDFLTRSAPWGPDFWFYFDFFLIFSSAWQICLIFVWFFLWFIFWISWKSSIYTDLPTNGVSILYPFKVGWFLIYLESVSRPTVGGRTPAAFRGSRLRGLRNAGILVPLRPQIQPPTWNRLFLEKIK